MDSQKIFEYLIPIVFFIVWVITKLFASKDEEQKQDTGSSPLTEDEPHKMEIPQEVYKEETSIDSTPVVLLPQDEYKPFDYIGELEKQRKKLLSMTSQTIEVPTKKQYTPKEKTYTKEMHIFQGIDLKELLSHHKIAQKAFVLQEVLNTPVSMRKNEIWH